ncbi:prolyl oligopeptidase family serine peptidase [Brevundimonas sp.]|uniref:S9 family peptidase n=1 Tax=Brevundimonas sp. TaxID=1871086 RepID=UPI0028A66895|nr:prolyl oligopeptidase family serine peptidase [Brevundimonas sp.]
MGKLASRLAAAMAAAVVTTAPAMAVETEAERPLTVEDVVSLEAFGRADISPDGRWLVYEKRGAYDTAPRFDLAWRSAWTLMDLWIVDLEAPAARPRLLLPGEGPGLQRMAWSPSGRRLLVTRLQGEAYDYGVVDVARGTVAWTDLAADVSTRGAEAEWMTDEALLVISRPDRSLPAAMRQDGGAQPRMAAAWRRTARGREASRTVVETRGGVEQAESPRPPRALVRLDLETGTKQVLAEGRLTDFALSPDRRLLAVVRGEEPVPVDPDIVVLTESDRRERLSLIDLETGVETHPGPGLDVAPHLLRWSWDSTAVLAWARADGSAWREGGLIKATRQGVERMIPEGLTPGDDAAILRGVRADWLGKHPVLLAQDDAGGRMDWRLLAGVGPPRTLTAGMRDVPARIASAGPDALHVFADGGYWAISTRGAQRLTPDGGRLRETVPYDPERSRRQAGAEAPRRDWSLATDETGAVVQVFADGGLRRISGGAASVVRTLSAAPGAALVLERKGLAETLRLRRGGEDRALDVVNADLSGVALAEPMPVAHPGVDGKPATSWLFLPRGAGTAPLRGLVVKVYPGSYDNLVWADPMTMTYGLRAQVLAGAGFAVLSPAMPPGRPEDRGDLYVRSVDLAVDAALAAHPELPRDRIGVLGHSFGGYAALEIAARSNRYRSYVASSSFSDMVGLWGEFEPASRIQPEEGMRLRANQGAAETGQHGLGAPPWRAQAVYEAASPYLKAEGIRAPVLFLTADMDFVPTGQAERVFSVLHRMGGRSRLVTYWGENHHVWSPANIRDRYAQIFDWLDETLSEPPARPDALPSDGPIPRTPPGP